jgi:hypothetical protein
MKLYNYYSLDECVDRKKVTATLKRYVKEGKIEYDLDKTTDVFHLEDLDLEEEDIELLVELFDSNDVFPYLDYDDEDDNEDGGYDDYYDDEDEY